MSLLLISCSILTACSKSDLDEKIVATVGEHEITMDEMLYYISYYEATGIYQKNYLAANSDYTGDFWNDESEDGVIFSEYYKKRAMDDAVSNEIFADIAEKEGYTLSAEELLEIDSKAAELYNGHNKEQIKQSGITEKGFKKAITTAQLSNKYLDKIMAELNEKIDAPALLKGMLPKDYREYKTEALFFQTKKMDANDEFTDLTKEEIDAAAEEFSKLIPITKSSSEFKDIHESYQGVLGIQYLTLQFMKGSDEIDQVYQDVAIKLKNGQISDFVQGEHGFYLIKMIDNHNLDAYEKAKNNILQTELDKLYLEVYEEVKKDYPIVIKEEVWNPVKIGTVTILPET